MNRARKGLRRASSMGIVAIILVGGMVGALFVDPSSAQTTRAGAPPKPPRPPTGPRPPKPPAGVAFKDGGTPTPREALRDSADGGGVVEVKTVDGGGRGFIFGKLEIEGRLKSPQLVYFLRRVRAEFAAGDLGHRTFMRELSESRKEPGF